MDSTDPANYKRSFTYSQKTATFCKTFNFMSKEKTVQKAAKKEPAKTLKEKQKDKKAKKEGKKFLQ